MACTIEPQTRRIPARARPTTAAPPARARVADKSAHPRRRASPAAFAWRFGTIGLLLLAHALSAVAAPPAHADAEAGLAAEVRAAVIMANGLERAYWDNPSALSGWDAVYAHFRRGYSAEIAERMTAFTLDNDGDMATWVPDAVQVVEVDEDSALAYFNTPAEFGLDGLWGFEAYMVVRLRREAERWIIDWATDSAKPPLPQASP